jgi:hypothetical protein
MAAQQPEKSRVSPAADPDRRVGELVAEASEQVSELLRQEMRLAVSEVGGKARHGGIGAGMFGGAGLVAVYGAGAAVAAGIAGLALVWPVWAAALAVAVVLLALAAVLALVGRGQARKATPVVPGQAIEEVKRDVSEVKERARR